ncbi:hypothetical protein [Paenibacillus sp. YYML68]|uniref:AAA family ATPase n=1 Tax=Paenibacillus sp. YYML68 TaxID=2909250 RepID=UPI0024909337|nr:hypothetical protein [Paenibacillus sp. YYML68]
MNILIALPPQLEDGLVSGLQAVWPIGQDRPEYVCGREALSTRIEQPYEALVVHSALWSEHYPWDWMRQVRRLQPIARIAVVLDAEVYDSFMLEAICRLANSLSMTTVPAGLHRQQLVDALYSFLLGSEPSSRPHQLGLKAAGQLVAVWSAASQDGATTIAMSAALAAAARSGLRVGLLDGNLRNPELRARFALRSQADSSLMLRSKLQTQRLLPDELRQACSRYRNQPELYILPGSPRRDTALDLSPDMMEHLLAVSRSAFDLTFVDVSTCPDNAATICAVREADRRLLVTQNRYASYRTSWGEWHASYWAYCGLSPADVELVVNRCLPGEKPERVAQYLNMKLAAAVPNVPGGVGITSADEGIPLYGMPQADSFAEAIDRLAMQLLPSAVDERLQLDQPQVAGARKTGWLTRLSAMLG